MIRHTTALLVIITLLCSLTNHASAQDGGQVADAATQAAGAGDEDGADVQPSDQSLGGMIISGGRLNIVFFVVLGMFSVWAATVSLERLVNLRRSRLLPDSFVQQLRNLLQGQQDTADNFQRLCETTKAPAARILHAGVLRAGRSLPEVEKAMEDAAAREMANLRTRNRPLSVVGSVAPLVGLLGTVVGMIMAFQISSQVGLGKAERLAEGIYLALMTTAAGLTIAIPCLLLVAWFNTKAERFMCDIDECLMDTMPSFTRMERDRFALSGNPRESRSEAAEYADCQTEG